MFNLFIISYAQKQSPEGVLYALYEGDLCSDNLDKADKAEDSYDYLTQQANDNPLNSVSLNPLRLRI